MKGEEKELLEQLEAWIENFSRPHGLFVFSLTELRNDLSQWCAYTKYGKGVCLSFEPPRIKKVAVGNAMRLARCVYQPGEKSELASSIVEKTLQSFRRGTIEPSGDANHEQRFHAGFERLASNFFYVMAAMKNSSFSHEKEWRLVSRYLARSDAAEHNNRTMSAMGAFMSRRKIAKSCFSCGIPYREWR